MHQEVQQQPWIPQLTVNSPTSSGGVAWPCKGRGPKKGKGKGKASEAARRAEAREEGGYEEEEDFATNPTAGALEAASTGGCG